MRGGEGRGEEMCGGDAGGEGRRIVVRENEDLSVLPAKMDFPRQPGSIYLYSKSIFAGGPHKRYVCENGFSQADNELHSGLHFF